MASAIPRGYATVRSGSSATRPPQLRSQSAGSGSLDHIPVVLTHFVIAGHSASEDARERAYDPAIHPLREKFVQGMMDHPKSGLPDFGRLVRKSDESDLRGQARG